MQTASAPERPGPELKLDEGFIASKDSLRLYWRSLAPADPAQARAHVAIVHGYCEHSGRYREAMERLARAGFAAHAFDFRGHGQSDGRRTHVEDFGDYVADLDALLERVRGQAAGRKVFLMGHSLGGLICARWALGRTGPVAALALVSPFMGMAFEPPRLKALFARFADKVVPWLPVPNGLALEGLTHDPEILRATERDPLYQRTTTPRWFREATRAQREVFERAGELTLPCQVMGGSEDPIADPKAIRRLHEAIGSQPKALQIYPGMLHEILNELDRERVWADLLAWWEQQLALDAPSA
ncbi:MAG: lysophospholipase [Myxococcales bacterium]|jgi:lysophospholipase